MLQNGFLEFPKTKYSVQSEKWLARNENKCSGNGFAPGARNALKQLSGGSKDQKFGSERKIARAQ